mmetsp:Transcript_35978/g.116189  ORF Transcript_35978/g.116189 Transcript_35978/m.116189 type:complete len:132 (+) Transcript_35978:911-1306(+)
MPSAMSMTRTSSGSTPSRRIGKFTQSPMIHATLRKRNVVSVLILRAAFCATLSLIRSAEAGVRPAKNFVGKVRPYFRSEEVDAPIKGGTKAIRAKTIQRTRMVIHEASSCGGGGGGGMSLIVQAQQDPQPV